MLRKILSAVLLTVLLFSMSAIPALSAPYVETKIGYGATVIYATDFDTDNYLETGATGASYAARPEMEAIGGPQTEANNIGWISAGEWVQYTVNVEVAGKYKFEASLASDAGTPGNVELYYDDTLIGASENSAKDGWQAYDTYAVGEIDMTVGTHVIKALFPSGNLNISDITVTALFASPPTEAVTEAPTAAPAAADNATAAESDAASTTAAADNNANSSNSMILWIVIAAGAVIVIIIIAVLVTRKKK